MAVVAVEHGIGEHRVDVSLMDPGTLFRRHARIDERGRGIPSGEAADIGDGVRRPERRAAHGNAFQCKHKLSSCGRWV